MHRDGLREGDEGPPPAAVPLPVGVAPSPLIRAPVMSISEAGLSIRCARERNRCLLIPPHIERELSDYLKALAQPGTWCGIAAFVLFSLVYRKHVRICYGDREEELVNTYAPWAKEYITEHAPLHVVACKCDQGKLRLLNPNLHGRDMNHWVAAWP